MNTFRYESVEIKKGDSYLTQRQMTWRISPRTLQQIHLFTKAILITFKIIRIFDQSTYSLTRYQENNIHGYNIWSLWAGLFLVIFWTEPVGLSPHKFTEPDGKTASPTKNNYFGQFSYSVSLRRCTGIYGFFVSL